ncbi:MAG: tRNA (adenosine(37)-N6)-threonylcarbamoyltransferase complex ATPase subunit type 1 TsaE [Alicyclobacillaceae bacterium]|nr:tRNA (adenosine(37)-N6)-threonylcarbamoyltransferase complex ATPase subunit type 1 TsaE [Alicyclobacillaceae bacterium]
MTDISITTHSRQETIRLGRLLGELLQPGDVVFLAGDLGAGKTTFSKGVAQGLGVAEELTSPTFTLVSEYEGRIPLVHMDLYRVSGESDVQSQIGWDDYLEGDAAVLVEWPGGLQDTVSDALHIRIAMGPPVQVDERVFHCRASGPKSLERLDEWVKRWLF